MIIDDIVVTDCLYFTMDGGCTMLKTCKGNNCYYKQLQRKTQECEEKQKIIDEIGSECKRISSNYTKDEARYKQALDKIEGICEPIDCKNPEECYMNQPDYYGEVYGCEPDDWEEPKQLTKCPSAVARAILQIINEVKNGTKD